jgi:hypothetical protein
MFTVILEIFFYKTTFFITYTFSELKKSLKDYLIILNFS